MALPTYTSDASDASPLAQGPLGRIAATASTSPLQRLQGMIKERLEQTSQAVPEAQQAVADTSQRYLDELQKPMTQGQWWSNTAAAMPMGLRQFGGLSDLAAFNQAAAGTNQLERTNTIAGLRGAMDVATADLKDTRAEEKDWLSNAARLGRTSGSDSLVRQQVS